MLSPDSNPVYLVQSNEAVSILCADNRRSDLEHPNEHTNNRFPRRPGELS